MTPGECGICKGNPQRRDWVNSQLVAKTPHLKIERQSRELGFNVKRETIRKHMNVCVAEAAAASDAARALVNKRWNSRGAARSRARNTEPPSPPKESLPAVSPQPLDLPDTDDMATLVRAAAVEKLRAGELKITTQDGLAAQSLLDRREEKKKDRELITQLGVLLSRGSEAPPMLNVTESEYQEVEDPLLIEATSG